MPNCCVNTKVLADASVPSDAILIAATAPAPRTTTTPTCSLLPSTSHVISTPVPKTTFGRTRRARHPWLSVGPERVSTR